MLEHQEVHLPFHRLTLIWLTLSGAAALAQEPGALESVGSAEDPGAQEDDDIDVLVLPGGEEGPAPIINGESADESLFPSTGGLLVRLDENGQEGVVLMCSSTLIAPDVVLIAAHCVDPVGLCQVEADCVAEVGWSREANLGAWTSLSESWPDDVIMATEWEMHPQWDYYALAYGLAENDDIALVFLESAVEDVTPALLPTELEAEEIEEGDEVSIVGWGFVDADGIDPYGVKMWGKSDISRIATYEMQIGMAFESVRKCHGDSGGPTFRDFPDSDSAIKERLIGVTSHTYDSTDCSETGGVDTRVDYHRSFIAAQMVSRCQAGTRVWCETEGIIPPPVEPKTNAELISDIKLIGCATGGGGAAPWAALVGLALTLGRRYRPAPSTR